MLCKCAQLPGSVGECGESADKKRQDMHPPFHNLFHSSSCSTARILMRPLLLTLTAKVGPQRINDIKKASNAFLVCPQKEGKTWMIEMSEQNPCEDARNILGVVTLKLVDLPLTSIFLSTANNKSLTKCAIARPSVEDRSL